MPKSIFTATATNGQTFKRTSESRTYTHMVVWMPSFEAEMVRAVATAADAKWLKQTAKDYAYYAQTIAIGAGGTRHSTYANGAPCSWEVKQDDVDRAVAAIAGATSVDEYIAAQQARLIDTVRAHSRNGRYRSWTDMGWCGRPDLAQKLAGQVRRRPGQVRILEAVRVK